MMIRSALLVMIAVAVTAFMSTCAFLFPLISPGESKVHRIANLWARMLLWLTSTRVDVIGRENVQIDKPHIFMANHQSDFDILIVLAHIPGQFRWIAKKELFKIPIFGKAMRNAGYIEIDRQNHEKALKSLDEAARKIREGKSVVTFPEGPQQGRNGQAVQAGDVPSGHRVGRSDHTHLDHRRQRDHAETIPECETGEDYDGDWPAGGCRRVHRGNPRSVDRAGEKHHHRQFRVPDDLRRRRFHNRQGRRTSHP
jgi:1-acyl-sn-glycerol-3-phosphate acyltransferase